MSTEAGAIEGSGAGRPRMGDRPHPHGRAGLERGDERQHQARPVLVALFAAFEILPVPEIRNSGRRGRP